MALRSPDGHRFMLGEAIYLLTTRPTRVLGVKPAMVRGIRQVNLDTSRPTVQGNVAGSSSVPTRTRHHHPDGTAAQRGVGLTLPSRLDQRRGQPGLRSGGFLDEPPLQDLV